MIEGMIEFFASAVMVFVLMICVVGFFASLR
jgi:hypothetical protein